MDGARSIRQRTDEDQIAKRSQAITMIKEAMWYKLFLIAKAKDERLVVPPEPDPSDCSITKRAWNREVFKWKHDTKALVERMPLYAPGPLPRYPSSMPLYAPRHTLEAHMQEKGEHRCKVAG